AGAVPAAARLQALLATPGAGRLARLRLAGEPGLHARLAVLLPARRAGRAGARGVVARAAATEPGPERHGAASRPDRSRARRGSQAERPRRPAGGRRASRPARAAPAAGGDGDRA